ncbi:bifunctional 6-phosphofructo-2-kinase fructose--bisphosphate 2-phosphatase [Lichtheimia corymbifera JMRC:FSU:9682]|uniref:Bifunctional 6-phosphofructo-2-kinase fructose--bisphosphate 2-phosphatase n=1 Tax=Lichtheimia corymbifera JMRC:FSU:9682 TaxID=1263082 RepID=A0A068RXV0_9FUNG|nr:bifunctional 6-phosphofructo-2-kinase fructose--bisphosphate 2-phosphatase [Lichtheimia corymbifera JMRC:FSU:9682]
MAAQLYKTDSGRLFHAGAIAIVTVGLPARGKTHVSRSLCRYLRWLGVATQVFSVGNYRRERLGSVVSKDMFDPGNEEAVAKRVAIANECLEDMISWLQTGGGQVGIYDGNNVTVARREEISKRLLAQGIHPLFIESLCDKPEIVFANIKSVKVSSPDYYGWEPEAAVEDYENRIKEHEAYYETINDVSMPFVKLINVGEHLVVNRVQGYLQSRIVYYLMNLHNRPRLIFFARSGMSFNDRSYKVDAELSPEGWEYAEKLKKFIIDYRSHKESPESKSADEERSLSVWTSTQKKSRQTASVFTEENAAVRQYSMLNQLNPGEVDGLTPEEIKQRYPEEMMRAKEDPYRHRFSRAESYHDLAVRLEAIIMELEREKNDVLIIAHETVLRCLYAYLFDRPESQIPQISIRRGTVIVVTPSAYGCKEARLDIQG